MKLNLKTENVSGGVSGGQWNNAENSAQVWEWSAQCIYRKSNKIALSASNDKRLKTRNEIISYLYGKVDGRVSNAKLIKYKKKKKIWIQRLTLIISQKETDSNIIHAAHGLLTIATE